MKTFNIKKLHTLGFASAVVLVAGWGGLAQAATETSNLSVTAEVTASCSITTSPVGFGNYDPVVAHASADLDATGTVTVTCTDGSSATISLGQGANFSTDRRLGDGGTNFITYNLFSDVGRTTVWDETTTVATTGTGLADPHTVYGRITASQNVPAGSYTDTVVATVTF